MLKKRSKKTYLNYYFVLLFVIIGIHLFLLSKLIFFPYQELFTYPYFVNSGLLPYKQIWDQHFPGLMFFPVNLATLGMTDEYSARFWAMLNVAFIQVLIFVVSRRIFKSDKNALFVNFVYLIWQPFFEGWVLWIDSFLPLFLLFSFYFSYHAFETKLNRSYLLSGLFLGAGIVLKQVVIPVAFLVGLVFLLARQRKGFSYFILGIIPFPLLMIFYFIKIDVFPDFWYWTVIYNLTTFSQFGKKYPDTPGLLRIVGVFGMSLFSLSFKKKRLVFWIFLFLLGGLASAYARFDFVHFQPVLPFLAIATVLSFQSLPFKGLAALIKGGYIAGSILLLTTFYRGHLGNKVFFFDQETKKIAEEIRQMALPKERIFIYGSIPHLYQMSDTLPVGDVYVQQFSWFFIVSEDQILRSLETGRPRLVVADRTVQVDNQFLVEYSKKINNFLWDNYVQVNKIGETEFLLRKDYYEDSN